MSRTLLFAFILGAIALTPSTQASADECRSLGCRAKRQLRPTRAIASAMPTWTESIEQAARQRGLEATAIAAAAKLEDAKRHLEQIEREWNDIVTRLAASSGADEALLASAAIHEEALNVRRAEAALQLDEATTQLTEARIAAHLISTGPLYVLSPRFLSPLN